MERVVVGVEGMHCDGCVRNITGVLKALPGVGQVDVSLEAKQATIDFDAAQVGLPQFKDAIEDAGFDVV